MVHVVFEGVDFGGKGICLKAIKDYELNKGDKKIFDVDEFQNKFGRNPVPGEFPNSPLVVIYSEPTFAGVGKLLRDQILKDKDVDHSVDIEAEAFALDRRMLFEQTFRGLITKGKKDLSILGSRGIISSLVYQGGRIVSERGNSYYEARDEILSLPGNYYVWTNFMPDAVGITVVNDVNQLLKRGEEREKKDGAKYETAENIIQISKMYTDPKLLEDLKRKTTLEIIDAEQSVDHTQSQAIDIWKKHTER